jgi:tRNA(Ile)-lysidine synthase TilS/MesJ
VLFSGGKDSSLALDLLLRAHKVFGFDCSAHAGIFPVHRYPDSEIIKITSYWQARGIKIQWHRVRETDEVLRNDVNPCLCCQKLRKKMLKAYLTSTVDDWKHLVLVTGYSLWDIVSYSLEHIITNVFSSPATVPDKRRFMETAQRFYPLLTMQEGYTVFRPLLKYEREEILTIINAAGIPTLSIPCRYSESRQKRVWEEYYRNVGAPFNYERVFDFARRCLGLPDIEAFTSIGKETYLRDVF